MRLDVDSKLSEQLKVSDYKDRSPQPNFGDVG